MTNCLWSYSFHYHITFYSKRVLFGRLPAKIALLHSILKNISLCWNLLCFTEVFVVKALMLYQFPYMAGLDDNFMGKFLLIGNIGFLFITQTSRLYIGSFHESLEYQILTGIRMSARTIFWPIYMTIILSLFGFAFGSITIKKFHEKLKEHNFQKNLNVKVNETISTVDVGQKKSVQNPPIVFNNSKHNIPLLNGIQFAIVGSAFFVIVTTFIFFFSYLGAYSNVNDDMIIYKSFLYRGHLNESIFSVILPILYLATKEDFCRFAKMIINNCHNL